MTVPWRRKGMPQKINEKKRKLKRLKRLRNLPSHPFYSSPEWLKLRYMVFLRDGKKCRLCGFQGLNQRLHVDHIKPRSKYPDIEMEISNLQVLCESCNLGKGAWDETDWRYIKT